jgi:RNA polymerase sigma-70 factor (ECF subfamily)
MAAPDALPATCWDIVRRAADGDAEARSSFGRAYLPLVRSMLASRWSGTALESDVDDAAQDVFVECFRTSGPLSRAAAERGDFRGFLFAIVRNVALRVEERARERVPNAVGLDEVRSRDEQLSQFFDREWAQMVMREAGGLMQARATASGAGARMRVELLRLRFAEDLPIRDIAAQWEMDADAVHRSYAKARDEFKSCLREVVSRLAVRGDDAIEAECRHLIGLLG